MRRFKIIVTGLGLFALMIVSSFGVSSVFAQDEDDATSSQTRSGRDTGQTERGATREERASERRTERSAVISEDREARVIAKCEGVQTSVSNRIENESVRFKKRSGTYVNLQEKLAVLSDRFEVSEVDTTELDSLIEELNRLIADFNETFTNYGYALSDMTAIDCSENVEEFLLALEDGRVYIDELKQKAAAIRVYITENIVFELNSIKTELKADSAESDV